MAMQDTLAQERQEIAAEAAAQARAGVSVHGVTERFIPVSQFELIERLTQADVWPDQNPRVVNNFFKFLIKWRHLSYADRQQELLRAYLPFNPDADVKVTQAFSNAEKAERQKRFIELTRQLLERANYDEIPHDRIAAVVSEQNPYGLELEVDLSDFEELHIFYRGESETTVPPSFVERHVLRKKPITLAIYQRLFVLLKLKPFETRVREIMLAERIDAKKAEKIVRRLRKSLPKNVTGDFVYLKLFKFIPRADLEMLFPNTRVKMRRIDKLQLSLTAGGGGAAGIAATVAKVSTLAALSNPVTAGMAMVGIGGIVFRQVTSVFAKRTSYMAQLAQNLYFHNLANNQGVMALLAERGEEEDIKEEVLLYTLLARSAMKRADLDDAKQAVEHYLMSEFQVRVNFDIYDALERLLRDRIVDERPDGTFVALQPAEAADHIDNRWDKYLDEIAAHDDVMIHVGSG